MKAKLFLPLVLVVLLGLLFAFQQKAKPKETSPIKKGMIKVTILYPNADGKEFDIDYYSS